MVKVHAAGVNPVDWKVCEGYMQKFMPLELPALMGREASGLVEAIGPDVTGFAIGDAVFGSAGRGCRATDSRVGRGTAGRRRPRPARRRLRPGSHDCRMWW